MILDSYLAILMCPALILFDFKTLYDKSKKIGHLTPELQFFSKIIFRAAMGALIDFKSFSTVFQSYQDDGRMMMRGSVQ